MMKTFAQYLDEKALQTVKSVASPSMRDPNWDRHHDIATKINIKNVKNLDRHLSKNIKLTGNHTQKYDAKQALDDYSGSFSDDINRGAHKYTRHLGHIISGTINASKPETKHFHVYTGISSEPGRSKRFSDFKQNKKTGNYEFRTKGFLSSSLKPSVAHEFASGIHHHILRIHIKPGQNHGMYLGKKYGLRGSDDSEHEYLINKNKKIIMHPKPEIKYEQGDKYHIWHAHIEDEPK